MTRKTKQLDKLLSHQQFIGFDKLQELHLSEAVNRIVPAFYRQGVAVYRAAEIKKLLEAGLIPQTR